MAPSKRSVNSDLLGLTGVHALTAARTAAYPRDLLLAVPDLIAGTDRSTSGAPLTSGDGRSQRGPIKRG